MFLNNLDELLYLIFFSFSKIKLLQVIRRLRDRNEPIRLFGESDYECYLRLKKLETDEPDAKEVTNSH